MADSKLTALSAVTTIDKTDELYLAVTTTGTPASRRMYAQYLAEGWTAVSDTWTYSDGATVNIPSDGTTIYQPGVKIRFKQGGGFKYFVARAVTATQIGVFVNADYIVANAAITDIAYSYTEYPFGFPEHFLLGAPTWTTTGTAFTNQPTGNTFKVNIKGRTIKVSGYATCHATSGGTGEFIATFPTGALPLAALYEAGAAHNFTAPSKTGNCSISATGNTIACRKYDATALATNSELFAFSITYLW